MTALTPAERAAALAVLGLPAEATSEQIIQAYRRLARAAHPDATGRTDSEAGDRFALISEAYHRLTAPPPEPPPTATVARRRPAPRRRTASRGEPPIVAGPVMFTPWPTSRRSREETRHG